MKIAVCGYGAMGKLLSETLKLKLGEDFIGVVDRNSEHCFENFNLLPEKPDVIIDFSHVDNLKELLKYSLQNKNSVLIATTGYSSEDINEIKRVSKEIPILMATNTSLGINLLNEIMAHIVPVLEEWDIEIIEKHHNKKMDSPSGTAKTLLEKINESLNQKKKYSYGRVGMEKREKDEIGVHSIRGGTIVGEHSVIFAGEDEIIEIKHEAHSKKIFINGAIKGAIWLAHKKPGLYTMKDLLF